MTTISDVTANTAAANPLISSSTTNSASSTSSLSSLNYNFQEFLTLFTTQLKNHDPTKPMDTTEMTNQLALFSNVEETAGVNSRLDKLLAAQQTTGPGAAVGYIGHTVEANGNQMLVAGGTGEVSYTMPEAGQSVRIDIRDSTGGLVATLSGDATAGSHQATWDGKDNSGAQVADGVYSLTVTATSGTTGTTITPVTRTTGQVTGVESDGTDTYLDLGSIKVKLSDVVALRA